MRKILFILALIYALLMPVFSVSALSWNWSSWPDHQVPYCQDGKCTLPDGATYLEEALGDNITNRPLADYIQEYVSYLLTFLTIIAVLYVIWAGFRIMTGNGDEEAVSQSKKTILYVAIGIIIIWLAYAIVSWIMRVTTGTITYHSPFKHITLISTAHASYTENEQGTFSEYRSRIRAALEELEAEMRINKQVSTQNLSALKQLVQNASDRLPDKDPQVASQNESAKRGVDMYIDLAIQKPTSTSAVSDAIRNTAQYINSAKIDSISGNISATPTEGNAPLTVSFRAANIKDPSGTTPPSNNYIWWMRENGGARKELWRGPSLSREFTEEGTFTVFLDVVSGSRNSRGFTDVLPFSSSVAIEVKPKLGEVVLLVNGVNVSNMDSLKISPLIANQGVIFDASASRAIGNGRIIETTWEFGNGNRLNYRGTPIIERQIYANQGNYPIKFSFKTNDGQELKKEFQLIVRDPSAVIKIDKDTAHVGESLTFSAESHYGESKNTTYTWEVQDDAGNRTIKSANGTTLTHEFDATGTYLVTLRARSANGTIDADSKRISIEAREPIVALDQPKIVSSELPNTFVFDAGKSYDPDTNSRTGLIYTWRVNNQRVELNNPTNNGARGELTFDSLGENTVSVTVTNPSGKVATAEQTFRVTSLLSAEIRISPQVTQVGQPVNFIANAPYADFFTWNMGDGSAQVSNSARTAQHTFQRAGIYNVTLTVNRGGGSEQNTVTRKIYVTDMSNPLAIIQASNSSNSVVQEDNICHNEPAWMVNRGESTTFDASQSVNTDGNTSNLDYTWRYMGKVSTNNRITETFGDLGCFPIELTVRSKLSGASNTTKQYIQLKNHPPELTNISTSVDSTKKDSQKVVVKATANGVQDPDGVVVSYIWYYTTESDPEPQNIQISQNPSMTFVLPNVTEKYYFGVILEDNDGARVNSADILQRSTPLIIDNANGNIYLPLITLSTSKTNAKVGEKIRFSVDAKTIIGTNVTSKSQYAWDFDGDGRIDERSSGPSIEYAYPKAGTYNMRVRVTHNGVSNTKYQTVYVRNELKASVQAYKIPGDKLYLLNTSEGVYDKVLWNFGETNSDSLYSLVLDFDDIPPANNGVLWKMTVSHNDSEISHTDITMRDIETVETNSNTVVYQSYPRADDSDTITISDPSQGLRLSLYGNEATRYVIDTDTDVDSNLDGTTDNDADNQGSPSYNDGSLFVIPDFNNTKKRERNIKITLYNGETSIQSKTIRLVFDFISESTDTDVSDTVDLSAILSEFDREQLDTLADLIRSLPSEDRIIVMQKYNLLVENWDSSFERAKNLIDIQEHVTYSHTIESATQDAISETIDALLRWSTTATNDIDIAVQLIRYLIPENSANYSAINEKLDAIASHPLNATANRELGQEILVLIQDDPTIEDKYKLHIKNQLQVILKGGSVNVSTDDIVPDSPSSSGSGLFGVLGSIVKVFLLIIAIIVFGILGIYIYFRATKKEGEAGFQDFLIDRVFHKKASSTEDTTPVVTIPVTSTPIPTPTPQAQNTDVAATTDAPSDPLTTYIPPDTDILASTEPPTVAPDQATMPQGNIPDWLTNTASQEWPQNNDILAVNAETQSTTVSAEESALPDWLWGTVTQDSTSPALDTNPDLATESNTSPFDPLASDSLQTPNQESIQDISSLPDWLQPPSDQDTSDVSWNEIPDTPIDSISQTEAIEWDKDEGISITDISESPQEESSIDALPDWLVQSAQESPSSSEAIDTESIEEISESANTSDTQEVISIDTNTHEADETPKTEENSTDTPQNNAPSPTLPDWLK